MKKHEKALQERLLLKSHCYDDPFASWTSEDAAEEQAAEEQAAEEQAAEEQAAEDASLAWAAEGEAVDWSSAWLMPRRSW